MAVAVVKAGSCSSDSTPSLGTSICHKYKRIKNKKKKRERDKKNKKKALKRIKKKEREIEFLSECSLV